MSAINPSLSVTEPFEQFVQATFLSGAEITSFYTQGFVVVKKAFSAAQVEEMSQSTDGILQRVFSQMVFPPYRNEIQAIEMDDSLVVFEKRIGKAPSILRVAGCGSMDPSLMNILRSDKMVCTFLDLLNCNELEHLICQFHPRLPGDGVLFHKHRDIDNRKRFDPDWRDINDLCSYASALIAIDPMTAENGCIYIDRSSFTIGVEGDGQPVMMEPGDMLFLHPLITHWSGPNNSSQRRRGLVTGFCIAGANSKSYPGKCVNEFLTVEGNRVVAKAAPWKN